MPVSYIVLDGDPGVIVRTETGDVTGAFVSYDEQKWSPENAARALMEGRPISAEEFRSTWPSLKDPAV